MEFFADRDGKKRGKDNIKTFSLSEIGRLESMASSPIYAHYTETLDGLDTIRAFRFENRLRIENENLIGKNVKAHFCLFTAHR